VPPDTLSITHDHYRETFSLIREREKDRDRSFLWLIGLFALIVLEVYYPASVGGTLGGFHFLGTDIDPSHLPLPMLLDASWVLVLAVTLNYCRAAINIDRQYPYLHRLEDKLSEQIADPDVFRREGRVYLDRYPLILNWSWFAYVVVFPLIVGLVSVLLVVRETSGLNYSIPHKAFDTAVAAMVVVSFAVYRVVPPIVELARNDAARSRLHPTFTQTK
jgi:hypothetical protein